MNLTKKEIYIIDLFSGGFSIELGIKMLIEQGYEEKEIHDIINKLKKEDYLEEVDTPVGLMLINNTKKMSYTELERLMKLSDKK